MKRWTVIAALVVAACGKNPRYCDESTPCADPSEVCDFRGACPESDYLTNSCIPEQAICWDAAPVPVDASTGEDAGCQSGDWIFEAVDRTGQVGACPAIAVDAAGAVHVIYADLTAHTINYASRSTSGQWTVEPLDDTMSTSCRPTTIAVDADGGVHVVYKVVDQTSIITSAHKPAGGQWTSTVVQNNDSLVSLAVDGAKGVHIAYSRPTPSPELRLTSKPDGGTWTDGLVEAGYGTAWVALGMTGATVRLVYTRINGSVYESRLATRETSSWAFENLPEYGYHSIAVDDAGTIHGFAWNTDEYYYLRRPASGGWTTEPILARNPATTIVAPSPHRIALDSAGGIHAAMPDYDRIAYGYRAATGGWTVTTLVPVAPGTATDLPDSAVTIDNQGLLHVVYYDPGTQDLYYAVQCP